MNAADQTKPTFIRTHVVPALLVFVIPLFSAWFFAYAERWMDDIVMEGVAESVQSDRELTAEQKEKIIEFHRAVPASRIMASNDPEMAPMQEMFEVAQLRYATFRWMKRIAWICLITIGATLLIVGLSVAFSFRSHSAQYHALRIGWPVLRTSATIQVIGQAVLATALSFWVTAIFTHSYFIKLIGIIGLLAIFAVWALLKAIFARTNDRFEIEGSTVSEVEAPSLWLRIREMASKLGTPAPDRIVVGIVPSFFVTEHPVTLSGQTQSGRTLYLSLPMLKVLAVEEADAVLGHELAHFSGQDTLWSRKISPLTQKFAIYLGTLSSGLSSVVADFMHLFWKLYNLSLKRLSRAREFRADEVGAELVSKDAMKRALIKITCYCEFRTKTENAVFEKRKVDEGLDLARQLEHGYPAFLAAFATDHQSINERVPHPFDSHPTLSNRLEHLGFEAEAALRDQEIQQPAETSWYQAILNAPELESKLWNTQQEAMQELHGQHLAWTLQPKTDEEVATVRAQFPQRVFQNSKGLQATIDYDRMQLPDWDGPIFFRDIFDLELKSAWGSKVLTLTIVNPAGGKPLVRKCRLEEFKQDGESLLAMFGHYYSRHKTAEQSNRG